MPNIQNETYTQMEDKQNRTIVFPRVEFENRFDRFIIDATNETGAYIVEDALNEMTTQGADTSIYTDGETPDIAEVAYTHKRKENFIYEVREDELKDASLSKEVEDALISKITSNLDRQDRINCYRQFPRLLSSYTLGGMVLKDTQKVTNISKTDYATIIKLMKGLVRQVKEPTSLYNSYSKTIGATTYNNLTSYTDRPIIFINAELYDAIMVDYESGVRNLEKIEVDADIVPISNFYLPSADGTSVSANIDNDMLFCVCSKDFVKIYRHFVKYTNVEDMRSFNKGKAVTYIEYLSKIANAVYVTSATTFPNDEQNDEPAEDVEDEPAEEE